MQVSYDDGATWWPAALKGSGTQWMLTLAHPARPGDVSLRAYAVDGRGNTLTQTIIRAYHIR